jgi:hypothetical protein
MAPLAGDKVLEIRKRSYVHSAFVDLRFFTALLHTPIYTFFLTVTNIHIHHSENNNQPKQLAWSNKVSPIKWNANFT